MSFPALHQDRRLAVRGLALGIGEEEPFAISFRIYERRIAITISLAADCSVTMRENPDDMGAVSN